jgi:hypothetical protein
MIQVGSYVRFRTKHNHDAVGKVVGLAYPNVLGNPKKYKIDQAKAMWEVLYPVWLQSGKGTWMQPVVLPSVFLQEVSEKEYFVYKLKNGL